MRLVTAFTIALALAACGGSGAEGLSPLAEEGHALLTSEGCAACHGSDGEGGIGPELAGLAGSEVELADGTTLTADTAYIRTSITDPGAQIVAGYQIQMPESALEPDQVDAIVAWIQESG